MEYELSVAFTEVVDPFAQAEAQADAADVFTLPEADEAPEGFGIFETPEQEYVFDGFTAGGIVFDLTGSSMEVAQMFIEGWNGIEGFVDTYSFQGMSGVVHFEFLEGGWSIMDGFAQG